MNKNGQKTLLIASVAEGEGKTITAANLAVMLSYAGNKVLLIDGNCDTNGNPGLSKLFDITPKDEDCLCARLETAMFRVCLLRRRKAPSAASEQRFFGRCGRYYRFRKKMNKLIRAAREQYDFIIIDTPALCRSGLAEYYAELSDCAVMVVRQGVASGRSIRDAVDTLSGSTQILGCILNDVRKVGFLSGLLSGGYGRQYGYGKYYSKYGYGDYGNTATAATAAAVHPKITGRETSMSEYDCRAGFRQHMHTEEKALPMRRIHHLIFRCLQDSLRMLLRLFWLPFFLLAVVFSALFCYNAKRSYRPMYKASATFTVNVVGMSGASAFIIPNQPRSSLREPFPYILTSGVLRNLICEDLKLKTLPASINAYVEGTTTLFTLETTAADPELAYKVLVSAIDKYPQVATMLSATRSSRSSALPQFPLHPITASVTQAVSKKGAALGILLGIAVAVIAAATRKTVRSTAELKSILNLRCIGTLPYERVNRRLRNKDSVSLRDDDVTKNFGDSIKLIRSRIQKIRRGTRRQSHFVRKLRSRRG